jgi:hypothetical protein
VPKLFGLAFTATGEVLRICSLVWRSGEMVGAEFLSAKELRAGAVSPAGAAKGKPAAAGKASAAPGSSGWISPVASRERR